MDKALWWQHGVLYQIYPRSFQDSDGDGIGDLAGIARRLDHLVALGVDAVWLSPIYPSPMADFGYDVSDYCGVDPVFGTLAEFDALVASLQRRGLRLILDLVPNHSSDRHPWFLESRSSRTSPKRDWYLWRDPAPGGGPPNNWLSNFGGSAWTWDAATGQYYLHSFLEQQPDLNWRNPAVRRAIYGVMRFWLDRGVAGFRVDVIWLLIKDDLFRDNPPNPGWRLGDPEQNRLLPLYTADRPETQEIVAEMRSVVDAYPDRLLIGEIYLPVARLVAYYGKDLKGAHLPFNFQLLSTAWSADAIARTIREYEAALPAGAWPNWVLGNHDNHRLASRIGPAQARVAAMLLLTLRGTPTIYYGEEIGMADITVAPDAVQDPYEKRQPGLGLGRDPARAPMPWDGTAGAGFTNGEPWLPLPHDHYTSNVAALSQDRHSILTLYRRLIALRQANSALSLGSLEDVTAEGTVLMYTRRYLGERLIVVLNLGHDACTVAPAIRMGDFEVLLSTDVDRDSQAADETVALGPAEGVIFRARGVHAP